MITLPDHARITAFVRESNFIEGINGVTTREVTATIAFLSLAEPSIGDLQELVTVYEPGAVLRDAVGLDVRVADHVPIAGGPEVTRQLAELLQRARDLDDAWEVHCDYERLHPFTDGNGRSGRALWAWQMTRLDDPKLALRLGFLQDFYYHALARRDALAMENVILAARLEDAQDAGA